MEGDDVQQSVVFSMLQTGLRSVLGRRLSNAEGEGQKIGAVSGLAAMGLDGLSSAAYGPEAAMAVLLPLGVASLGLVFPVMLAVVALLFVLYASYWQTITAYPSNGGSYTVASENLGRRFGLLAATALMVDYTLNVAVGISAGIGALTSALPALAPHTLALCLAVLVLVTLVNMRGTADAGAVFTLPTYLFIGCWVVILGLGLWAVAVSAGHPHAIVRPPAGPRGTGAFDLWIVLCAFANGCTAMTGVEAVSNGVSAFKPPPVRHAHRTLSAIVLLLALLLAVIAYLIKFYGIYAMDQDKPGYQSVLSQLALAVIGHGPFYYIAIAAVLAVLCLSANTSFTDFPRLCRKLAQDRFLPATFEAPGRRLVYTTGILFLALAAGALLVAFDGITDALIPLFAIGAFTAFVLSQLGMAVHWWRQRRASGRGWPARLVVNGFGAALTTVALLIIIVTKFLAGAWVTLIAIPLVFALLWRIRTYYLSIGEGLACGPLEIRMTEPPVVLIPFQYWNKLTAKALRFAMRISPDVAAIHLLALDGPEAEESEQRLRAEWQENVSTPTERAGLRAPELLLVRSPYRRFLKPLVRIVREAEHRYPDRQIAVLIPQLVKTHWWDYLLLISRARALREAILREGSSRTVVINVPWHMEQI
jgi:amino acid transporter